MEDDREARIRGVIEGQLDSLLCRNPVVERAYISEYGAGFEEALIEQLVRACKEQEHVPESELELFELMLEIAKLV